MFSIVLSAAIAAILLLCVVYSIRSNKLAKNLKLSVNNVWENIQKERSNWQNQVNAYKDGYEYYKEQYEKEEKRKWELINKQPCYEFILGNKETGWCWMEVFDNYPKLNIGDTVKLRKSDTEEIECMVERFNGVCQFKDYAPYISFNVVECPPNNA